ncbi:hypothetical protein FACS1894206_05790 [Deltaproteobacteria bacterium]|nr:hypothetical protein FACS1894206_05790 [Deltaproteobacteria bacterium]
MLMNTDIRLAVSFRGHRKRKRLRLLLGPGSTDYLIDLWIATAMNHPDGILKGMDAIDIALEAGWEGEAQVFVSALIECGFLNQTESGAYFLHDWEDHQGYVVHADERKSKAKNAAARRWQGANANSMPQACSEHTIGIAESDLSNAPSPAPLPSPSPNPAPVPEPSPLPAPNASGRCEKQKPPCPVFGEDAEAYKLAVLMRDTLRANLPTLKEPNIQSWARDFDLALRNDPRMTEPQFVAQVIRWSCSDAFWRGIIHSPAKLREKLDQLAAKMEARASPHLQSPATRRVNANLAASDEAKILLFSGAEADHDQT